MPRASTRPVPDFVLRITLVETAPPIWRDLLVPGTASFLDLHAAIQLAFPWTNSHLHQFTAKGERISDRRFEFDVPVRDERRLLLKNVVRKVGDEFTYDYDFGDDWRHHVVVTEVRPGTTGARSPKFRCLGGARACPPDDCGGTPGYEDLLVALADPKHERHQELTGWLRSYRAELAGYDRRFRGPFVPSDFDVAAADRALSRLVPGEGLPELD